MKKMMIVILVAVVCVAAAFGGCRFIRGQILDGPGMERDTLYNEDAVIAQVNAVYDYWNELRTNFDALCDCRRPFRHQGVATGAR